MVNDKVYLCWGDEQIGFLNKGRNIFSPKVGTINSEFLYFLPQKTKSTILRIFGKERNEFLNSIF